jgi:hypothetical protein
MSNLPGIHLSGTLVAYTSAPNPYKSPINTSYLSQVPNILVVEDPTGKFMEVTPKSNTIMILAHDSQHTQ